MNSKLFQWLLAMFFMLGWGTSQAAITCSVSSNGFTVGYNPAVQTVVQTSVTVTCNRGLASDPTSVSYSITSDNGIYALGVNNRARNGASFLRYDVYTDSACGIHWKGATAISGVITFSSTGSVSNTHNFWSCINAGPTPAAGTYSDVVTVTLSYGPNPQLVAYGSYPVSIITPATCSLSSAPGTVAFGTYVAFGGALGASTGFGTTCSNNLPYTLAVTPTGGTIAGLNYTLLLRSAAPVMSGTNLNATGSGVQQSYTIDGTMAAGQSGVCAAGVCTGAVPHTLTITY